ncbi:MAG TPA: STAS domain-containing protein [Methylomirabilota bacterium]|jgi:anti-anti-sigma factor
MALDIVLADEGQGRRRVRLTGRLDTVTAPELDTRLAPVLGDPAVNAVVLDLAALDYISSAGIRSVVKARKALEGRGGSLALVNLQAPVQKVFDIVKALPSSQIFGSATELDAYLDMMQRRARRG